MGKHKWAKEIKAWADGAEIDGKPKHEIDWQLTPNPWWSREDWEYRIKPQPKEPQYLYVYKVNNLITLVQEGGYIEHQKNNYYEYIGKIKLENEDAI